MLCGEGENATTYLALSYNVGNREEMAFSVLQSIQFDNSQQSCLTQRLELGK